MLTRLRLKAKLRHHHRGPGNVDPESIQLEWTDLTLLFAQLKQLQQVAGVAEPNATIISISEMAYAWDDLAFDPVLAEADISTFNNSEPPLPASHSTPNISNDIGPVPIRDQVIALCSNGNTSNAYRNLEIRHCTLMAGEQIHDLHHIWNLIAEKSFRFSHVIHVSPCKAVTTRARAAVKKLNNQIAEHCRFYRSEERRVGKEC